MNPYKNGINFTETEQKLLEKMSGMKVVDCHEHLPPEKNRVALPQDVFTLFSHYTRLPLFTSGLSEEEKKQIHDQKIPLEKRWSIFRPHLNNIRFCSYTRASFIAAREVYGFDDINDRNYKEISKAVSEMNKKGIYKKILSDMCNIEIVLTQCSSTEVEAPLVPVMNVRHLINIHEKSQLEEISKQFDMKVNCLDDYLNLCRKQLKIWVEEGTVGIKYWSYHGEEPDRKKAEDCFTRILHGEDFANTSLNFDLKNFLIHHIYDMAAEMDLVVALHSGVWNDFRDSDPRHMTRWAAWHPDTRFDLYHLGMPEVRAAVMVGAMFPNVWLNLCWTHIISEEMTCSGINEIIDLVPINKILAFGGDYGNPVEKVVGHLRMAKENIARVLAMRIDRGRMDFNDAEELIRLWFWENPFKLYTKLNSG